MNEQEKQNYDKIVQTVEVILAELEPHELNALKMCFLLGMDTQSLKRKSWYPKVEPLFTGVEKVMHDETVRIVRLLLGVAGER